jgi:hypothetical protein
VADFGGAVGVVGHGGLGRGLAVAEG